MTGIKAQRGYKVPSYKGGLVCSTMPRAKNGGNFSVSADNTEMPSTGVLLLSSWVSGAKSLTVIVIRWDSYSKMWADKPRGKEINQDAHFGRSQNELRSRKAFYAQEP